MFFSCVIHAGDHYSWQSQHSTGDGRNDENKTRGMERGHKCQHSTKHNVNRQRIEHVNTMYAVKTVCCYKQLDSKCVGPVI